MAERQDPALCLRILALRDYRDARRAYDEATKDNPPPASLQGSRVEAVWNLVMGLKSGSLTTEQAEQALRDFDTREES